MADNNNPLDDLLDDTKPKKSQTPSLEDAQYTFSPEETQASSYAISDIWGKVPEDWVLDAPDTIQHITLPENQIFQQASMQAFEYLRLIYGPQLTPTLQAALIQNKDQREYAYSVLQQIAEQDLAVDPTRFAAARGAGGGAPSSVDIDPELMSQVIADPKLLDTLDPTTRNSVIQQARAAGQALGGQTTGNTASQFFHIANQTATRNYDVFMSPEEKATLEQVLAYAGEGTPAGQGGRVANVVEEAKSIGVSSIQNAGHANPTIILDEKWARARPVRAAAVMDYLRTQLPGVAFRVGEKGLVGKVLDVLGKPVDVISAPIGAAYGALGEVSEELSDKLRYDDQDRARMAQDADNLQRQLESGNIAPEDWDAAMRQIQHLRDNAEENISYDFGEAIDTGLHPRDAGFGFAENYTEALDLLPGDPGYDAAYAISGLAANIVFDPLNFALPAVAGVRAAKHTVAGAGELAGKVDYTLDAFRTMGNAPDATRVARASVADVLPAAPKTVEEVVGKGRYIILETPSDDIAKALKARGYSFGKATLNGNDAILIPKVTLEEGIHLAKEAGLTSFLSTEGIVDVGSRTVRQVDKVLTNTTNATDVVRFGDRAWGYRIGNKTTKLRPERISGGYTKNWFYQKFVKSPDEWVTTKPAREAAHQMWITRQAVGREAFLSRVQRLFGVDERVARVLTNARSEDDLLMAMQAAMTGNLAAPFNEAKNLQRLQEAVARLDEGDGLRAEGHLAETRFADFEENPPQTFQPGDDLSSVGATDDEYVYHVTPSQNGPSIARGEIEARVLGSRPEELPVALQRPGGISGRAFVADNPDIAINATKFQEGARMVIRIPKSRVESLGLFPDTAPVSGSYFTKQGIPTVHAEYLTESGEWKPLIERPDPRFAELEASRADDVAEAAYLRSMNSGRDFNIALRELPNARAWRRFLGKEGRGPIGRALLSVAEFTERFPGNLIGMGPKRLAQWLQTSEGRVAERAAKQASAGLGRWFRPHGAGENIRFPWVARQEGELADAVVESADNLRNFLKTFAVPDKHAERLVGAFLDLRNERQSFEWLKSFWVTIGDESPLLTSVGREEVKKVWQSLRGERAPGYLTKSKEGEFVTYESTLFRTVENPDGSLDQLSVPTFTADMFQGGYKLPELDAVLEYISFNRRMLRNWSKAGDVRKPIANALLEGRRIWDGVNAWWKTTVLLGKLPFGLPLRIIGEEQVRIAAFDEASLLNHPVGWFRAVRHADEFELFTESNAAHLGLLGEQFLSRARKIRTGRTVVQIEDGDLYFRAAGTKVAKLAKSPEVARFYLDKTPEEALALMESGEGLSRGTGDILGLWDELIHPKGVTSRLDAVKRAQREIEQLVGGNDKIKAAIRSGHMTDGSGELLDAGTQAFADELARMHAAGEWTPSAKRLPASTEDFEIVAPRNGLQAFRDMMFQNFYTRPDVYFARAPLFRQVALREFKRLRSLGWKEEKALASAKAVAARRVSDMLYKIGETTAAHHWLRNIAPFFPAFEELTKTWLYRVPKAMGGGFYLPGAVRLARKADVFMDFLKHSGAVRRDENGEWVVRVPGLGPAIAAIMGGANAVVNLVGPDVDFTPAPGFEAEAHLSSFTGVLPDPFGFNEDWKEGIKGLLPGVGAPTAAALTIMANKTDFLDDFVDFLLPFGRDVSLGPSAVDKVLMAMGIEPWWNFGSPDYMKALKGYAIDDGIRIELTKTPPPTREEGESDAAFNKRWQAWSEGVLERAERRASLQYAVRGVVSSISPFSATYDDKYTREMEEMWGLLSTFPDGGGDLVGPMIDAFKAKYPEAVWHINGKTINLEQDRNFSRTDAFAIEWTDQHRFEMSPEEYLRWTVGMNSFSIYMNKLDRAYDELGQTPSEVLLNGFQRSSTIPMLRKEWEDYLDWTDSVTPDGERSFHDLYKVWDKAREDEGIQSLTKSQEAALELKEALGEASRLFTEGGIRDTDYRAVARRASEIISTIDFPESGSAIGKGIDWWWQNVGDPYGDKLSKLYEGLDEIDSPFERAAVYAQIRELANSQKPQSYNGVKMPTPEQVFFNNLSPEEQDARRLEWGTLPVEWLTDFQMDQVGVKTSDKLTQLATFINDNEVVFDKVVAENDISSSSNDYEALRRAFDIRAYDKAKDLGLTKQFALMKAPVYKRIDEFFGKEFSNTSWQKVVQMADQANRAIDSAAEGSITATREAVSKWLVDQVRSIRSNDKSFNGVMERLEVAFAPSGKERLTPDLLTLKLFFDYFGSTAPAYLYV